MLSSDSPRFDWKGFAQQEVHKVITDLNKHYLLDIPLPLKMPRIIRQIEDFLQGLPKTTEEKEMLAEDMVETVEEAYHIAGISIPNPEREINADTLNFVGIDYDYLIDLFYFIIDKIYENFVVNSKCP